MNKNPNVLLTQPISDWESACILYGIFCVITPELCKDKRCIYHITSLVSAGIFRPWASTFTRPEKWYSIQCLHFIWAHHWLTQIDAFTEIDFYIPPHKKTPQANNPQQVRTLVRQHFCNLRRVFLFCISCFSLSACALKNKTAKKQKNRRVSDHSTCFGLFLYRLSTVWTRQASAQKLKRCSSSPLALDVTHSWGMQAAALRLW